MTEPLLAHVQTRHDGTPLLLIHGFPHRATFWAPLIERLPASVRVVAPDLPGFGDTPPRGDAATMDAYADLCVELLDALGIERAVVGGLSMGGYVVLALWRRHARRVRALALMDTRAGADSDESRRKRRETIAVARRDGAAAVADAQLTGAIGRTTREHRPEIASALRELMASATVDGIVAASEAMLARPDSTSTLGSITVPTLVLVGDEDVLTPPREARALHESIPGSSLVVIRGAGHASAFERPDAVAGELRQFLGALPPHDGSGER